MTRPAMPTWATALLVAPPCSVLASLLTILLVQPGAPAPAPAQAAQAEIGEALRELAELQRSVDERLTGLECMEASGRAC